MYPGLATSGIKGCGSYVRTCACSSASTCPTAWVQDDLRDASGLDFTDPGQAHVTLKFLGETDPDRLPEIEDALADAVEGAGVGPFEATVEGLGAFPSTEYIRVVWLGIGRGSEQLTRLHEAIEGRTTDLGFDPEDHAFTPHVTIARMNHAGGKKLVQRVLREHDPDVGTMHVEEVRLTESVLGTEGPAYSTVARFPLG
jgi:2'-5' RNA ligase